MGYADKSLAPGETILYRARYHWIFYRSGLLVLFLAALLGAASLYASRIPSGSEIAGPVGYLALGFAVLALMLLGARWVRAQQDEFVVTDRRVLRAVGLVTREHEQAPIEKIQDITVTQSGLGRLLGYGDVTLETASERGTLLFPAIATPEAFRTAIWGRPRADTAMGLAMPPAPSIGPATSTAPTPSSRLEQLENLRRKGMVSEAEYAEKRREILAHL
ncbi:MAG: PH domain-containing protein [Acidobacteriota bacterium]